MSALHDIIYAAAGLVSSPLWGYRLLRTGKWRTDWPARFGKTAPLPPFAGKTILLHAVSVGEVNALRLLVRELESRLSGLGPGVSQEQKAGPPNASLATPDTRPPAPALRLVICATTDTGLRRARELFAPRHPVTRYPLDFTPSVNRFLDAVRPDLVALVELEVWPNFVAQCVKRSIPVCIINGRLSARSFKRYKLIRPLLRSTFASLRAVGAQDRDYADRITAMGAASDRVAVLDTMKWDNAQPLGEDAHALDAVPGARDLARDLGIDLSPGHAPIIVAGSTAPGEDKLILEGCPEKCQIILVPRKPEWFDDAAALSPGIVRRTHHPAGSSRPMDGQRAFLLDTIGELKKAYALADLCVVGRSFLGLYGSDMMEPIALGKPTIIGPHHSDFADIMKALRAEEGILVTGDPGAAIKELLADPARAAALAGRGRRVILSRQGSVKRHAEMLLGILNREVRP